MKGEAKREWILRSPDPDAVRELSTRNGLAPAASKVLVNGTTTYSFRLVFAVWVSALALSVLLAASLRFFGRREPEL